jgi:hypothetical protein
MTTTINASPTNGIVQTADGSGVMKLQSNGVTTNALAWVNFVGSTGVVTSGYNISSITRNGGGDYTFNFTTSTTDANYTYIAQGYAGGSNYQIGGGQQGSGTVKSTSSLRIQYGYVSSTIGNLTNQDPAAGYLIIFGN